MNAVVEQALGSGWRLDFGAWDAGQAARQRAVPARDAEGRLWLLADRERDAALAALLEARLGCRLRWLRCDVGALDAWLREGEAGYRALAGMAEGEADSGAGDATLRELSLEQLASATSPAVRLLDAVLYDALQDGASDIHVESDPAGAQIRLRVDGVMQPVRRIDGRPLGEQVVSRLKVLAELDIGERRLPQDGRFRLRVGARDVDFRLSIMPTAHGEDAVVRVLDRGGSGGAEGLTLAALGYDEPTAALLLAQARQPHGMLLVTGPTGSGKTTTLYAAILQTRGSHDKIVTIEDPVEYRLAGVAQIPVNERQGLSFARGLRSVLRHDPDRIMVGEIRDAETAQIAVQAALTGHLVFSTVHANGALEVVGRFMHMGLDLYHVVTALNLVVAQRLMRQRCDACGGAGCAACRGSGYRGRRAIAEVLQLDDELRDLIASRAPMARLKQAARERGLVPLHEVARAAVRAGWTTQEEFERVTLAA